MNDKVNFLLTDKGFKLVNCESGKYLAQVDKVKEGSDGQD